MKRMVGGAFLFVFGCCLSFAQTPSHSLLLTPSTNSLELVVPNVSRTVDDGGGSGLLSGQLRYQIAYDASLFPAEIMRITELRMRPSAQWGGAFTSTIPNLQINLSTTSVEPDRLNGTFAQNVGTNDTVVFQGPLTVSSQFVGPMNGPKEFDIIIPLSTPFLYDPSRGNLLVDFRNASGSSATYVDIGQRSDDGASRIFAFSLDATLSTGADSLAEVFQIVYTLQGGSAPSIIGQPQSRSVFAGETASLSVQAAGTAPLRYQWFKGDTTIAEGTSAVLTFANVQPGDTGSYSVVVSNAYGAVTSESATLTLSESLPVVVPNVNRTVDGGSGSGLLNTSLRYQIVYDTSLFPVAMMRITELRMRPSAGFGTAFTATISNLQINLSTTSVEPNQLNRVFAQNVGVNDTVVFQGPLTVSSRFQGPASGPKEFDIIISLTNPFFYDPSRGNLLIDVRNASGSGATFVDLGQREDDGASRAFAFSADATSSAWADSGAEVFQILYTLETGEPPLIVSQPSSRTAFSSETVTLTVGVWGSSPLNYQWLRDGSQISDETNTTLILTNVQVSQGGNYSLVVSNAFGVVTSQIATLTVLESSALVVPTASRTNDGGSGSGLLRTRSRHQIVYGASQFPSEIIKITELRLRPSAQFGGAFTSTIPNLQINLSTTSIEPDYFNGGFAQNVGPDEVVVFQGPLMVSSDFVGPANGPKEFDIIIPLATPFLYDPSRGNLLIDVRNAFGSNASFVDTGSRPNDGASRVFATSANASSYTGIDSVAEVFQIVYTPQTEVTPLIFAQPPSRTAFLGHTATLTIGVLGTPPLNYQWRRDGTVIPEGTNATLVLTNVQIGQAGNYTVVVSNAFGTVTSQMATLTVSESSALVVPNVSGTIDDGGGSGLLNTQLRHQIVYDSSLFPGEILRITELRMRPSSRFGTAFTATISNLQINLSTTSAEPNQLNGVFAQNVGTNDTVVFQGPLTVSSRFVGPATGPKDFDIVIRLMTPFVYDPVRGNLLIDVRNASSSGATHIDLGRQTQDGASRIFATSVNATSSTAADFGAEVFQIVYVPQSGVPPLIFAQPSSRTAFSGETVTVTVGVSGNHPLNYQWRKGSTEIIGATNAVLTLTNVQPSDGGTYSVMVSNAFGTDTSQTATLTVSESSLLVLPNVNATIDDHGGSGLLNTQSRHQIVYDDSLFPVEIMRITELRMRPSSRFGSAFTSTIPNLQINLSTTSVEPDHLNGTFVQNVGTNDTVVFHGPLTVSSRFVGPATGPKEFDIIIPLTTPFLYDPSRGNLLIDFRNASGSSATYVDAGQRRTDDGASRQLATAVDATSSTGADSAAEVIQIVYMLQGGTVPSIFGQPQNRNVFAGETASLSVVAVGTSPLKYQWLKGDTTIAGGTNAVLTFANVQPSHVGNYSVVVSNAYGVVTSQSAALTLSEGFPLVLPRANGTSDGGSGSGLLNTPLRHQIVYDDSLFPVELMRITELRLRPSAAFGRAFTATISNLQINLSTTSIEPDHLNGTFAQNVGPDEVVVFQGSLAVSSRFVGPANGPKEFDIIIPLTTPFLYDPRRGNLLIDFRNFSGSSATFVDIGQETDDGASRLYATSAHATSYTGVDSGAEVFQIVYTPQSGVAPVIFAQPSSRAAALGETVVLSVGASGSSPLSYQWHKGSTEIIAATNSTLMLMDVQLANAGSYSVLVSNSFGVAAGRTATLTISESPPLVVPNLSRTIDGGNGSGLLNQQRRHQIVYRASLFPVEIIRIMELRLRPSAVSGSPFTATISNLQVNLSTTRIEPDHLNGMFAQNVGPDDTAVFQGPLAISSQFVGPANGPKEFDIIIPLVTQFLYDPRRGNLLIDFRNVSGSSATFVDIGQGTNDGASRLSATSVEATSSAQFDSAAEVFQIVYTIEVVPPLIFAQPPSHTALLGQTVTLNVGVEGSPPLNYQWRRDGTAIADGTNATLILTNVQVSHAGDYSVTVSNAFGTTTSQAATFTIIPVALDADYDLSRDFSLAGNPNGAWSYGRQDTVGGAFTLLGTAKTIYANVPMVLWAINFSSQPAIFHNDTTGIVTTTEGIFPPETTWFGPGVQGYPGNYAVARLTVPVAGGGTYQLMSTARPAYHAPLQQDTDFHMARNNVEIFGAHLKGDQIAGYADTMALIEGDTIDFAVGRGADDSHINSLLKVEAKLTKLFSNLQPSITNVSGGNRTFALTFNGALGTYTIEASTNLVHWITLTNIIGATGRVLVTDPAINPLPQRFYRARILQ